MIPWPICYPTSSVKRIPKETLSMPSLLITGGSGTFGKACLARLLKGDAYDRIIIYSRDEFKQQEMAETLSDPRIRYFIGDVRDKERLIRAFHGVDTGIHAAALKQIRTGEYNPREVILTNIVGAMNVVEAAIDAGVKRVMAISTDKAVQPVNLYGATKLCAEKLFVRANAYAAGTATRFACVRYGNVIGSRGSLFDRWNNGSGKVVVTDPRMTRFATTAEQAVAFVLACLDRMQGGEIFVPKLRAFRLLDAIRQVTATGDVEIIGAQPGEKIHETLIGPEEQGVVDCGDSFVIEPAKPSWQYKPIGLHVEPSAFTSDQSISDQWEAPHHDFSI